MDHENNSNIASMVPGTMSDFFTTVYTNLFLVVEPVPNREYTQRILFGKHASVAVHSEWDRSRRIWQKRMAFDEG